MSTAEHIGRDDSAREVAVGISAHLDPDTAMSVRLHADEGRAVVHLGRYPSLTRVDLFADRAALLRLRDLLDDAVFAIDTASESTSTSTIGTSTTVATAGDDEAA